MHQLKVQRNGNVATIEAEGDWSVRSIAALGMQLQKVRDGQIRQIVLLTHNIKSIDTIGAWLIYKFIHGCKSQGLVVQTPQIHPQLQNIFESLNLKEVADNSANFCVKKPWNVLIGLNDLGRLACAKQRQLTKFLSFFGLIICRMAKLICSMKLPIQQIVIQLEHVGLKALPVIGVISVLLGMVLIYQAVFQLEKFGAEIFAIDMLAISLSREISVLITSIVLAGRSGSAFTAQLGIMKINQEIDALKVLGLNPVDLLVIPRICALVIALPLMSFYALSLGFFGGYVISYLHMQIDWLQYASQVKQSMSLGSLLVGLVKAPFFAFLIGLVGCFKGFNVENNAASIGVNTTNSVVESIFLVIVFNAMFSIMFTFMGI